MKKGLKTTTVVLKEEPTLRNIFSDDPFSSLCLGRPTSNQSSLIHKYHHSTSNHRHTTDFSRSCSLLSCSIHIFKSTDKWSLCNMLVMPLTISRGRQKGLNDLRLAHFILEKERLEAVQHSAAQHKRLLLIHHRHQQDNNSWPAQKTKHICE